MRKARPTPSPEPQNGRERLIGAAVRLFGRDGFDATSVRALADEADVSWGLVRFYFGSKEGLREAAEERVAASYLDRVDAAARTGSAEELEEIIEAQTAGLSGDARFLRRAIMEERPMASDFIRRLLAATEANIKAHIAPGQEPWMYDSTRSAVARLGYLLLAPQFQSLLGRDVYSVEELKQRNATERRVEQLIALGQKAERKAGKGKIG
ncbi:MAG: TetR/AcrR family transcriptional regulator [Caulobacteraceae bacterium]